MKKIVFIGLFVIVSWSVFSRSLDEEFITACRRGEQAKAESLLNEGANIEARDGCDHQTALVFAANEGHLVIVKMLVEHKANINAQDDKGWTALSEASYRGRTDVVKYLLSKKASTLPSTSWLDSREHGNALFWCIESSHNDYSSKVNIVKELLDNNAEPEGVDKQNRDSLAIAKDRNYKEIIDLLEKYQKEHIAKMNEYALLDAIRKQNIKKAKEFLSKGVNPNALLPNGESILNYAVSARNYDIVRLLLEFGASPDTQNELGTTALMTAVKYGDEAIINALLRNNVNLNQRDKIGRTAIFYAVENNDDIVLSNLISAGASKNVKDIYGESPFLYACKIGNISACKLLSKNGCDTYSADIYGNTPLHIAVQKDDISLVKFILSSGDVDVLATDAQGNDVLYYANKIGNNRIINLLEVDDEE